MTTNITYYHYEGYAVINNVRFIVSAVFVDGVEMKHLDLDSLMVATSTGRIVFNKRICKKFRLLIKHRDANITLKSILRWNDDGTFSDVANDNN